MCVNIYSLLYADVLNVFQWRQPQTCLQRKTPLFSCGWWCNTLPCEQVMLAHCCGNLYADGFVKLSHKQDWELGVRSGCRVGRVAFFWPQAGFVSCSSWVFVSALQMVGVQCLHQSNNHHYNKHEVRLLEVLNASIAFLEFMPCTLKCQNIYWG